MTYTVSSGTLNPTQLQLQDVSLEAVFPRPPYSRVPVHTLYCSSVTSRLEEIDRRSGMYAAKPALRTEEDRRAVEDHIRSIGKQFA